jgi:cholesterol transport system auxiliary component
MEKFSLLARRFRPSVFIFLLFSLWVLIIAGCVRTGKPQAPVEMYLMNYPAPVFAAADKIDETIRLNRFTIATAYNSNSMIFRQENYSFDSFNYNRWAVNPADMVGDILLRDLQSANLFRAAFSRYAVDEGRYIVAGGIEEFFLRKDSSGNAAVLGLNITLKDTKQRESTKRILFQKKYFREEALTEQSPRGYCQAMSRAMQQLSTQIIDDIYQGVKASQKDGKK